jgi:hypothetical protein
MLDTENHEYFSVIHGFPCGSCRRMMNDGVNNEILSNSGYSSFKIDYNNTIVLACPVEIDKHWWLQYDLKLSFTLV